MAQRYSMTFYNQWNEVYMFRTADILDVTDITPKVDSIPDRGVDLINSLGKSPIHVRRQLPWPVRLGQVRIPGLYEFDIVDTLGIDRNYLFCYSLNHEESLASRIIYKRGPKAAGRDTLTKVLDTLDQALSKIAKDTLNKQLGSILSIYSGRLDSSSSFGFTAIITKEDPVIFLCTEQKRTSAIDSAIQILNELVQTLTITLAAEKSDVLPASTYISDPTQELATLEYWLQPANYESANNHLYHKEVSSSSVEDMAKYYPEKADLTKDVLWFGFDRRGPGQFIIIFRLVNKKKNKN